MSLLKKAKSKKLQSLVLASVLVLTVGTSCNPANAAISTSSISLEKPFICEVGTGDERGYLVYSPTDKTIIGRDRWVDKVVGTLQGGKLYYVQNSEVFSKHLFCR